MKHEVSRNLLFPTPHWDSEMELSTPNCALFYAFWYTWEARQRTLATCVLRPCYTTALFLLDKADSRCAELP